MPRWAAPPAPAHRSVLNWLIGFLKVGSVSFGGGAPSIPVLQRELVDKGILSKKDFADGLALANVTPGPILTNMAVYAGIRATGSAAAVAALAGAVVPSVAFMAVATQLFLSYGSLPALKAALHAIQPVVIALLVMTVVKLVPASLASKHQVAIAAAALLALLAFKVHPGLLIVSVAAGALLVSRAPSAAGAAPEDLPPGSVYLAVKRLPRLADVHTRCYAFVAIDSASCWTHMSVGRSNTPDAVARFVARLLDAAPFKVAAVLVGKDAAFAVPPGRFEARCRDLGVDLQVAGNGAALPHLRIEQFNRRLRRVLAHLHRQPLAAARQTLRRYAWLHNELQVQKAPHAITPSETLQQWQASHPHLFVKGRLRPALAVG